MPLIKSGAEAENHWVFVADEAPLAGIGAFTLTVERFLSDASQILGGNQQVGVRLRPEDDPAAIEPYLDTIALIEVEFPKYTDGRGYSQAQLLRRRYGYTGELRAVGHVLRDQIFYMNRSGFDAYETDRAALHEVVEALAEYSSVYQKAADGHAPVFARRHRDA